MARLEIYKAGNGMWSGRLKDDSGEEICGVAGCRSPEEVEEAAREQGIEFETVPASAPEQSAERP
jgi:hypothetical protein